MTISYILVLIALAALGGAIWALFWAIDSGQYDDLESQGGVPLEDELPPERDAKGQGG
jgi:cbb3-type cytochrome oxidase maturation protein